MYPTLAKNFDEGHYHIETSPLIFSANQWTDFYMIWISVMKELSKFDIDTQCNTIFQIHSWIILASVGFPLMIWPVNDESSKYLFLRTSVAKVRKFWRFQVFFRIFF